MLRSALDTYLRLRAHIMQQTGEFSIAPRGALEDVINIFYFPACSKRGTPRRNNDWESTAMFRMRMDGWFADLKLACRFRWQLSLNLLIRWHCLHPELRDPPAQSARFDKVSRRLVLWGRPFNSASNMRHLPRMRGSAILPVMEMFNACGKPLQLRRNRHGARPCLSRGERLDDEVKAHRLFAFRGSVCPLRITIPSLVLPPKSLRHEPPTLEFSRSMSAQFGSG